MDSKARGGAGTRRLLVGRGPVACAPDLGLERPNQPQPGDPHGVTPISVSRSKRERPRALGALGAPRPHEQDALLPPLGLQRPSCRAAILFPESVSVTGPGEGGGTWRWVGKALEMCTLSSFPLPRPARRAAADTAVPRPDRKRPQGCLGTARHVSQREVPRSSARACPAPGDRQPALRRV